MNKRDEKLRERADKKGEELGYILYVWVKDNVHNEHDCAAAGRSLAAALVAVAQRASIRVGGEKGFALDLVSTAINDAAELIINK